MSTTPAEESVSTVLVPVESDRTRGLIAWSSFLFAVLQSICGAAIVINGFRIAIGVGALVFSSGAGAAMVRFHTNWIRIPMISLALIGSFVNIAILIHIRRLRNRPAAQWRRKPRTPHEVRIERLQWALSVAAVVLIGIEEYLHFGFHHTL